MPEFMLLIRGGDDDNRSPEETQQVIEKFVAWANKLREAGKFKGGKKLESHGRVVAMKQGAITDGPFTETKDAVGGYFLVEATNYEEAVEMAGGCPSLAWDGTVEVRQVPDMG